MEPCKTGVMSAMMSGSESAGDVSCGSFATKFRWVRPPIPSALP